MSPTVSCIFPPSLATPEHIALAEELGYARAWVYDSPAAYADPWMVLALAAQRTSRIGVGPAVLVPSLRHPAVNAAALATLDGLAPGRVTTAFGTGLTGRMLLGERPMKWADVAAYVRAVRGLLAGEEVLWEGKALRLVQRDGFAGARPAQVEILLGADGPKGTAIADELADGIFTARAPGESDGRRRTALVFGTVLDEGETTSDPRVVEAAGPALVVAYHTIYEGRGAAGVDKLPGGAAWRAAVEAVPEVRRHLAIHTDHLVAPNEYDQLILNEAVPAGLLGKWTTTGDASTVRGRVAKLAESGVSEIAYQPIGSDIPRELRAFAAAVNA